MQLFYNENIAPNTKEFSFDKEESKHIVKVLRKKENDSIYISNGKGYVFTAAITFANEKKCTVNIINETFYNADLFYIHIAIAPTKLNDRFEWFLEKVTEIGVHEITPIVCEHSERKIYKTERAEKIIQSAFKQSNRYYIPKINQPVQLSDFVKSNSSDLKFIAHCQEQDKKSLFYSVEKNKKCTILIGPEGDFSLKEITFALQNNYKPISLGNNRLRTETAGIIACHTVVLKNEN